MTEDELFAAVHEYVDHRYDGAGLEATRPRGKLLDAISAYNRAMWKQWVPLPELRLVEAKAAVCDAFMRDFANSHHDIKLSDDTVKLMRRLRELESK